MKVFFFYGSLSEFGKCIPDDGVTSIVDLAIKFDEEHRKFSVKGQNLPEEEKVHYESVIGYSDDYSSLAEGTIEGFVNFIFRFDIDTLYLQNPPDSIARHLQELPDVSCETDRQEYHSLGIEQLKTINDNYSDKIIGQEKARKNLVGALYDVAKDRYNKPCVMLFYGSTGVGKTETAKFIADALNEHLFRKQFSMLHSDEFTSYLFGGKHNQNSLAKELLERESNVILFDEFDKPHPVFYSAFYQLFDEGVFTDKNYTVRMKNAIIICTSNFKTLEEIRERLGDPIFSRFDTIIRFDDLSSDSVKKILQREFDTQYKKLDDYEKKYIDEENLKVKLLQYSSGLKNARQIKRVVREAISGVMIKKVL